MSMTTADSVAFVRSLLKEATAKFWTPTDITSYLTVAMSIVLSKYTPQLYESCKSWADLGMVANTADYTIATAIAADVFKIGRVLVKETGRDLRYVHVDELWKYTQVTGQDPVGWTYKDKRAKIALLPTPANTDSDYLQVFYMPTLTTIADFPDCLQSLICIEAVIYGKTKDEDVTPDLLSMREWHEEAARIDLSMAAVGIVESFPDDELGDD